MTHKSFGFFAICTLLLTALQSEAAAQQPITDASVVFAEKDGLLAVESEHFFKQTQADVRAFYLTHSELTPDPNSQCEKTVSNSTNG
jgi:hypothetical protein